MKIKLGVLFGGMSVEHEISIITAIQAMNNIDKMKYDIIPIYIAKDGIWYSGSRNCGRSTSTPRSNKKRVSHSTPLYRVILTTPIGKPVSFCRKFITVL